ncbi:MAG: 16S rRNA (adenine(1518)-N(6)/adenine(1519)-N(6))-dimethyltransferase RsmA [Acidobacteriota bacterium]
MRPKKSLGQNFLRDQRTVSKIVALLDLSEEDSVIEIGCGTGILTRHLAGQVRRFVGVELDSELAHKLSVEFALPGVSILNQDVLDLDFSGLGETRGREIRWKIVGNLPYYITSPILRHLGRHSNSVERAVVMVQAEVAERLRAQPATKAYGLLTLLVQWSFEVESPFRVPSRCFWPVPKVDSAVVPLKPKPDRPLDPGATDAFFKFLSQSFSQRRKTLRNCLRGTVASIDLETILREEGWPTAVRAEALSLDDFVRLFRRLHPPAGEVRNKR